MNLSDPQNAGETEAEYFAETDLAALEQTAALVDQRVFDLAETSLAETREALEFSNSDAEAVSAEAVAELAVNDALDVLVSDLINKEYDKTTYIDAVIDAACEHIELMIKAYQNHSPEMIVQSCIGKVLFNQMENINVYSNFQEAA